MGCNGHAKGQILGIFLKEEAVGLVPLLHPILHPATRRLDADLHFDEWGHTPGMASPELSLGRWEAEPPHEPQSANLQTST